MLLPRIPVSALLLFLPFFSLAQVLDHVNIRLKVTEKTVDKIQALANAKLKISDYGEGVTDDRGFFDFTYAVRKNVDPKISIALLPDEYKVLKPLDGSIEIDTSDESMFLEFFVVNMAEESEAFKKRIDELQGRIDRLKSKNALTQRQLNEVNNRLMDTIIYFETMREGLERQIVEYENVTAEQQREIDAQRKQIANLEDQVDQLSSELEAALEERYIRQNQYFKDISSNLYGYLRKAKDVRDHLPYINTYFSSAGGYENMGRDINGYNAQWEKFDDNRLSYLEGVEHYWESDAVVREVEDLFDFLAKGIHQDQMYPTMHQINSELHKQNPRKAQKAADLAYEDMVINLRELEKRINSALSDLRRNL